MKEGFAKTVFHAGVGSTIALFFAVILLMSLKLQNARNMETDVSRAPEDIFETVILSKLDTILPESVLRQDFPFWPINQGFIPVSTILTEDKKHLLVTEISDCVLATDEACTPILHIVSKNLVTGDSNLIYNGGSTEHNLYSLPIAYFPSDHKILAQLVSLGTGGGTDRTHFFVTIDTRTGAIENFATTLEFLFGDARYLFTESSDASPNACGPDRNNNGKIVSRNAPNGNPVTLLEEADTSYEILGVYEADFFFRSTSLSKSEDGCAEFTGEPALRSLPLTTSR